MGHLSSEPGEPIVIYPIHSESLADKYDSDVAWIDVLWDLAGREQRQHKCVISLQSLNKPGSLAQIASVIAAGQVNIHNLVMRMESPDFHKFIFQLEVRDLAQLTGVLGSLKLTTNLSGVRRATATEARSLSRVEWTAPTSQKEPA